LSNNLVLKGRILLWEDMFVISDVMSTI